MKHQKLFELIYNTIMNLTRLKTTKNLLESFYFFCKIIETIPNSDRNKVVFYLLCLYRMTKYTYFQYSMLSNRLH